MKLAVVEVAAKQFLVEEGQVIETPKLTGNQAGDEVSFPDVLMFWDGKRLEVGRPRLEGFSVEGTVLEYLRGPKIIVYKFKRRKDSHKKAGHRQDFCRVRVTGIKTAKSAAKAAPKAAAKAPAEADDPEPGQE